MTLEEQQLDCLICFNRYCEVPLHTQTCCPEIGHRIYLQMYALAMMLSRRSLNSKKVSALQRRVTVALKEHSPISQRQHGFKSPSVDDWL